MASTHIFPQTGDNDDAENFAQLIGQTNLQDYVEQGMGLTPDYTNLTVTIGTGLAFIGVGSQTASSTGETRLSTTMAVQVSSATKSLTDAAVNHIYVEPDIGTDDNASYAVYTNTGNASADALKIGEVDTSANTSTTVNREPDITVKSATADGIYSIHNSNTFLSFYNGGLLVRADDGAGTTVNRIDVGEGGPVQFQNGNVITRNNRMYVDNHGFGGSPNIALAVGDTDTGLHSTTDGLLEIWNNSTKRGEVDSNGNLSIEGTLTEGAAL